MKKAEIFFMSAIFRAIPRAMAQFDAWQKNFLEKVNLYSPLWNWNADTVSEWQKLAAGIPSKKTVFEAAWSIVSSGEFTRSQEQDLLAARRDYESGENVPTDTSLRLFLNRYIRYNTKVTVGQKIDLGILPPDTMMTTTTTADARIALCQSSALTGIVKSMAHLEHISLVKSPDSKSRAKEIEVDVIEVHIAFGDAQSFIPPATASFFYDGLVKNGLYKRSFTPEQEGMRVWYIARKRMKGKVASYGVWSEPWSAVIP